jgi:hypothetical protein
MTLALRRSWGFLNGGSIFHADGTTAKHAVMTCRETHKIVPKEVLKREFEELSIPVGMHLVQNLRSPVSWFIQFQKYIDCPAEQFRNRHA